MRFLFALCPACRWLECSIFYARLAGYPVSGFQSRSGFPAGRPVIQYPASGPGPVFRLAGRLSGIRLPVPLTTTVRVLCWDNLWHNIGDPRFEAQPLCPQFWNNKKRRTAVVPRSCVEKPPTMLHLMLYLPSVCCAPELYHQNVHFVIPFVGV